MISSYLLVAFAPVAFFVVVIARRLRMHSIVHLPGPLARSWLVGNIPDLLRPASVGDKEFGWVETFGNSMRIGGTFGSDVLFSVDPKLFQYTLNTAGYNFPKSPTIRMTIRLVTGKGIVWAEGAQHSRHRKIMDPAFSHSSLKTYLPMFRQTAQKMVGQWKDLVVQGGNTSSILDIPSWLSRLTLDAIGAAAFDYEFGALDEGTRNQLAMVYHNLFADAYHNRSDYTLAFENILGYLPEWMIAILQNIPNKQVARLQDYMKVARQVARSLIDHQIELHKAEKQGGKDILSVLVRANLSENPKTNLDDEELLAQMTTLMVSGHETTASTMNWVLYELSKHIEFQNAVRNEIKAARVQAAQRGDVELNLIDLESMKYLDALLKETLRFHPTLFSLSLIAGRDEIIPLSTPQKTKSGDMITCIPVSRGQKIHLSIAGYNRLKSVWGGDADIWRPERFLEGVVNDQKPGLGVYGNLATFSSGVRSCIGWRFALVEMQAILIELIENFEFSPPPGNVEIIRAPTSLMSPMVKGSDMGRTQLPLTVTPVM